MRQPADINWDADFYTKHCGLSTRGLWTVEEAMGFQQIPLAEFEAGIKGWEEKAPGWEDYDNSYKSFNPDQI